MSAAASSSWERVTPAVGVAPGQVAGNDGIHIGLPGAQVPQDGGPSTPSSDEIGDQGDGDAADLANDAEGVWSPDIEQSFQEALAIYPPCGRRKIILSDEGKMYGRNELIARYIKLRTGKVRTRKQVSSHIQVLARKKARDLQSRLKETTNNKEHDVIRTVLQSFPNMSSAQIVSSAFVKNNQDGSVGPEDAQGQTTPYPTVANAAPTTTAAASNAAGAANATAASSVHPMVVTSVAAPPVGRSSPTLLIKQEPTGGASTATAHVWHPGSAPPVGMSGAMFPAGAEMMYARSVGSSGITSPPPGYMMGQAMHNAALQRLHMASPSLPGVVGIAYSPGSFRLVDFHTYVEPVPEEGEPTMQHLFVHIGPNTNFADPNMEAICISQIADKFPSLKEMFDKGPQSAFFLVKFWADMNVSPEIENHKSSYGVSATYESSVDVMCSCSTKVCSFGQQVVEKVETQRAMLDGDRYIVALHRSPMCEYMVNFIQKLRALPKRSMMNSVLENFTILQLVVNRDTGDLLLCLAFVFEVSNEQGSYHHIYRLAKD